MLTLDYATFSFWGTDPDFEAPNNRFPCIVHFIPLQGLEYTVRVFVRNKLISQGGLTGSPDRWIAEVFAMRGLLEPMIFSEDLTG